jgi:hypothetical protein
LLAQFQCVVYRLHHSSQASQPCGGWHIGEQLPQMVGLGERVSVANAGPCPVPGPGTGQAAAAAATAGAQHQAKHQLPLMKAKLTSPRVEPFDPPEMTALAPAQAHAPAGCPSAHADDDDAIATAGEATLTVQTKEVCVVNSSPAPATLSSSQPPTSHSRVASETVPAGASASENLPSLDEASSAAAPDAALPDRATASPLADVAESVLAGERGCRACLFSTRYGHSCALQKHKKVTATATPVRKVTTRQSSVDMDTDDSAASSRADSDQSKGQQQGAAAAAGEAAAGAAASAAAEADAAAAGAAVAAATASAGPKKRRKTVAARSGAPLPPPPALQRVENGSLEGGSAVENETVESDADEGGAAEGDGSQEAAGSGSAGERPQSSPQVDAKQRKNGHKKKRPQPEGGVFHGIYGILPPGTAPSYNVRKYCGFANCCMMDKAANLLRCALCENRQVTRLDLNQALLHPQPHPAIAFIRFSHRLHTHHPPIHA